LDGGRRFSLAPRPKMDYDIEMEDALIEPYPDEAPTSQDILPVDDAQVR